MVYIEVINKGELKMETNKEEKQFSESKVDYYSEEFLAELRKKTNKESDEELNKFVDDMQKSTKEFLKSIGRE